MGVKRAVDAGRCRMAIVVPHDFSQELATTSAASVQAILDATDDNTANIALGYAQAVVAGLFQRRPAAANAKPRQPAPIVPAVASIARLVQRGSREPQLHHSRRGRDGLGAGRRAAHLADISREWERGTMELLVSTPVTPMELMLGKLVPYFVIGLVDAALLPGARGLLVRGAVPRHAVRRSSSRPRCSSSWCSASAI